jgi:hypothetical protein
MKLLIAIVLGATICCDARAYMDHIPEWDSIEIRTVVDGERVIVAATAAKDRLTGLVLTARGVRIVVSPEEFADLQRPRLQTLRVVSPDVKLSPGPTVRVEMAVENGALLSGEMGLVNFHFGQGKYLGRDVSYKQFVREGKLPGKPAQRLETFMPGAPAAQPGAAADRPQAGGR